jgi:transcriptional regulator with XRE-family HTH domain
VATNGARPAVATAVRAWRERRQLSQLALAERAKVSQKHLSFIETGRTMPSREMLLHLAHHLDVPLRHRNDLLVAAGYAPRYSAVAWDDDEFAPIREAVHTVLHAHEPAPTVVVDHCWNLLAANRAASLLAEDVAPELLEPPVNVLRLCLHPEGLAPRILNLDEWSDHILTNLAKQIALAASPPLEALRDELLGHLASQGVTPTTHPEPPRLAVPLHLDTSDGPLRLLVTIATFGTALDATLAELTIEAFLPADPASLDILTRRQPTHA